MSNLVLKKSIDEIVFASLDVETTGLSPLNSRVCEIAAVTFQNDERKENFSSLINPEMDIPAVASNVHGITDDMIAGSPKFGEVIPKLAAIMEGTVLLGHNVKFDIKFLQMEFERVGMKFPELEFVDTLEIARKFGNFTNNRLGTVAKELGIAAEGWHRALSDVIMTQKIFEHFSLVFKKDGVVTLNDMMRKIKAGK
ncbi:MAG: 3'-5' exonuclease [Elusimicrobiota bacterium]|nr:3'-5' exonuclease [Elusimicrobiota bacterium]